MTGYHALPRSVVADLIAEDVDQLDNDDLADYLAGRPEVLRLVLEQLPSLDLDRVWPDLVAVAQRRGVKGA